MRACSRRDWLERLRRTCGKSGEDAGRDGAVLPQQIDLALFAIRLVKGQLAFIDRSSQQESGGKPHQAGGEAHAFAGTGQRIVAGERLGLSASRESVGNFVSRPSRCD